MYRENRRRLGAGRCDGAEPLHRLRHLVHHRAPGDGGTASVVTTRGVISNDVNQRSALEISKRSQRFGLWLAEIWSIHARLSTPQAGAGSGSRATGGTGQILAGPTGPPSDPRAAMRRIAAEAVILQDEAEAVIRGARAREGLGFLAPRGGPLYGASSASETCFRGHATTLPTRSGAASWTRSCTTTLWRCGLPWICLLMNGGRRKSLASWTRLTGSATRRSA